MIQKLQNTLDEKGVSKKLNQSLLLAMIYKVNVKLQS